MEALKACGVCRNYATREVLKDFDLTLAPGSFAALMGPSGSGKSTFLHIAAGLLGVDGGSVCVGGEEMTRLSDSAAARVRRRRIGIVFQAFNLLNERTVAENILLPLALDGKAKTPEAQSRLATLAARLGLTAHLTKKPEELSGGEQQRVAIARALIVNPVLVLADEPTGNLDAQAAKELCRLLRDLNATEQAAILVVTHDPVVAACAQTVHFLRAGKIAASAETLGDPARVSQLYLETYR